MLRQTAGVTRELARLFIRIEFKRIANAMIIRCRRMLRQTAGSLSITFVAMDYLGSIPPPFAVDCTKLLIGATPAPEAHSLQ
jgi:hypothetical protein